MDEGVDGECNDCGIVFWELAGASEKIERIFCRVAGNFEGEDELEFGRAFEGEAEVGERTEFETLFWSVTFEGIVRDSFRKALAGGIGDGGTELILVLEVSVGGGVGNGGATGKLAESKGGETLFAYQFQGGSEKGLAQLAVMVRFGIGHKEIVSQNVGTDNLETNDRLIQI